MPRKNLRNAHGDLKRTIDDLRSHVLERSDKAKRDIDEVQTGTQSSQWRTAMEDSERRFQEVSAQLAGEGISNPNEYDQLLSQASALTWSIAALERDIESAAALENEAAEALAKYREQRSELSSRRKSFVEGASGEVIHVETDAFGDTANLAEDLREALGIERFEEDRRAIVQRIQPQQNQSWGWGQLDHEVATMRDFQSGKLDNLPTRDHRFEAALRAVPPERIDRLALYLPGDSVTVNFRDHQGGGWRSLAQGSPGQQTAALLAFVLGYGAEPIILDQPEDDLDNTLIYELLVSRLRETKLKRQIIVVTHNPNIVVHGDAELVLAMDISGGQSKIVCQGGLQERQVRRKICDVMEGGEEAFESRYQRIMPTERLVP